MGGGGGASDMGGGGGGHTGGNGGNTRSAAKSYNAGTNPVNTNGTGNTTPNDGTVLIELISTLSPDVTPPTVVCKTKTVFLSATGTASIVPADVFQSGTDNCGTVTPTSVSPDAFTCANLGPNTVTLTASDESGNTATCIATVVVADNIRPTVTCKNPTVYLSAAGTVTVTTADIYQSGSDNCGNVYVSITAPSTYNCSKLGTNNLQLQAYDGNGNSAACVAVVTVAESTPPTASCKDATVYLSAAGTATVPPADVFLSGTDNCGVVNPTSVSPATLTCANLGTNTVTLTASDVSGNTATCTATVTLLDNTPPSVICKNFTAYLSAAGTATVSPGNVYQSGTDNCGTVNLSTVYPDNFTCSNLGPNTVYLLALDGNGNSSGCVATVTVTENIPPTASCKNTTVQLSAAGTATVAPADVFQSGTDNCGVVNPTSVSPATLTCANLGTNTVTLTASDVSGNTATCTATVTVQDKIPPSVTCKSFTAYLSAAGTATVTPADVYQGGTDNCGTVYPSTVSPNSFTCNNLGPNTVFLLAYDGNGNSSGCTTTVTVADNAPPTAICKNATVYLSAAGTANVTTADVFQSGADNCGVVNPTSVSPNAFTCGNLGNNTVVLTVNDGHGNTATCTATVTVQDKISPSVTCKSFTAYLSAAGTATVTPADVFQSGTDNCGTVYPSTVSPNSFTCNNLGPNTVYLLADDGNGNSSGCTATVTVVDNAPPTVSCKNATVYLSAAGTANVTTADVFQSGADNCGVVNPTSVSPNAFTCGNLGNNTVVLTVNDGHGNTATCNATVAVRDERAPAVSCPANQNVVPTLASICTATLANIDATASDNCSFALSYALSGATTASGNGQASGLTFNSGNTTVVYTATDGSGNSGTCSFLVTVAPCINGRIIWKQDQSTGVKDVTVAISGDQTLSALTGADGVYGFVLPSGANFTIAPSKNLNKLNGVNAQDVFRLQQHLSGNLITNPWQLIAADANSNGQINSLDLSIIQQSILGSPSAQAQMVKSWRFVPTNHVLNNPPWGFPENIVLTGISGKQTNQDFYGVKVGDLVASYANPANGGQGKVLTLRTADQTLQAGQTLSVELEAGAFSDLAALQFALRFDPEQLRLAKIDPLNGLPLAPEHIGAHDAENGSLRVLWAGQTPQSLKSASPMLRLQFEVLEGGGLLSEVLHLDDETLTGQVYTSQSVASGVSLRFQPLATTTATDALDSPGLLRLQNYPNPFHQQTTLAFGLPEACEVQLCLYDAGGRAVRAWKQQCPAGRNELGIDLGDTAIGSFRCELKTPFGAQTIQIIRLE